MALRGYWFYPVQYRPEVPKGAERIRTLISAIHKQWDLDFAIEKIAEVRKELVI
ncbi:MAG: hypothetical protein ACYSUY_10175 [Planctomycetota bacterium]|jgi:7-keto-8-aminopelargonate synthetase-like enzyme